MQLKRSFCLVLAILLPVTFSIAQIRIIPANIDDWVKKNFSGQGVVIGNISHKGNQQSMASFTSSANVLQISKGLILSTGYASTASGANTKYNQSKAFVEMKNPETDPDLSKLIDKKLYDITLIEFDFVPLGNSLQFNYQFGSDEYPEWVGSGYNDIFAFFVSDETTTANIAIVPNTSIPVSINTINSKAYSDLFLDNNVFSEVVIRSQAPSVKTSYRRSFPGRVWQGIKNFFTSRPSQGFDRTVVRPDQELLKKVNQGLYRNLQYDGITKKLVAQTYVQPYKKYHLKIVIADASDNVYDSGVFIEDRSLTAKRDTLQPGFVDYPDYSKQINPALILEGKKLEELLAARPIMPSPATTPAAKPSSAQTVIAKPAAETDTAKPVVAAKVEDPNAALIAENPENAILYFDTDKSDVREEDRIKLKKAVEIYERVKANYNIQLTGHTDSQGNLEYNMALSKRRNKAVTDILHALSVHDSEIISISAKAFLQPAADNATDSGRQKNRRVEITFVKK